MLQENITITLSVSRVHDSYVQLDVISDDIRDTTVDIDLLGQQSLVTTGLLWDEKIRSGAESRITDEVFRFPSDLSWRIDVGFVYKQDEDGFHAFALVPANVLEIKLGAAVSLTFKYDASIQSIRVV